MIQGQTIRNRKPTVTIGLVCKPFKNDPSRIGLPSGVVELGGKLYSVTMSNSKKDGVEAWVTFMALQPRNAQKRGI